MKSFFVSLSLLFVVCQSVTAQSTSIIDLENDANGTSGPARVDKMLIVANAYFNAGNMEKAIEWAENTADMARRLKRPEQRALALNLQGKALMKADKRGGLFGNKERAAPKFRLSADILRESGINNRTLALDNLENLRALALRAGRNGEVVELDARIEQLKGGGSAHTDSVWRVLKLSFMEPPGRIGPDLAAEL